MEVGIIGAVVEFINGVGFPTAVCVALFWSNHQNEKNQTQILNEFKEVLRDNTEMLSKIALKVGEK